MRKRNFLNRECPIRVLEEKVTWGEFIALYIRGSIGAIGFYIFYIMVVALADVVEVVG